MCVCIRQWVLLKLQYIRRYIALCEPSRYRLLVFVIKSLVWCFLLFFSPQKFGHRYWHPEFPRRLGSEPASPGFRDLNMESLLVSKTVHLCLNTETQYLHNTLQKLGLSTDILTVDAVSWLLRFSVRYGQLSGMVEPIAGLLGAFAVVLAEPLLPYALAFAAGAMVYVVVDDIIPEAQVRWEGKGGIKVQI